MSALFCVYLCGGICLWSFQLSTSYYAKSPLVKLLYPLSLLFRLVVAIRGFCYDNRLFKISNADIPQVVSVGNLSTGGTGKTPFCLMLIGQYLKAGKQVAYLSRGYGRQTKGLLEVNEKGDSKTFGDEALLIKHRYPAIPVLVCEDRLKGAAYLREKYAVEVLILDDAFQHRALYRDHDIVLIDAQRLPTQDYLLPAGSLREPLSALYRADELVVNKWTDKAEIPAITAALKPHLAAHARLRFVQTRLSRLLSFDQKTILALSHFPQALAFAGLGNPDFFFRQLAENGISLSEKLRYPDHHEYTTRDFQQWESLAKLYPNTPFITTEKDYMRLRNRKECEGLELYYVEMEMYG